MSGDGREIEGLNVIMQHAGARQVIASLWQVEDKSTALLTNAPAIRPFGQVRSRQCARLAEGAIRASRL